MGKNVPTDVLYPTIPGLLKQLELYFSLLFYLVFHCLVCSPFGFYALKHADLVISIELTYWLSNTPFCHSLQGRSYLIIT